MTRRLVFLILLHVALLPGRVEAQSFVEAVARLHLQAQHDSADWFEGFGAVVAGTPAPYPCHRSNGARVPALVARTTDGAMSFTWQTALLPANRKGRSATFLWVCGIGANLGNEWFELTVNQTHRLRFSTPADTHWRISTPDGASLEFVALERNRNGALFGYSRLTIPGAWLEAGRPQFISIRGEAGSHEVWYRTFEYTDALAFLHAHERRAIYHELSFRHLGAATLKLAAAGARAGEPVTVQAAQHEIGRDVFRSAGDVALAFINIPREQQFELHGAVQLQVAGRTVQAVELPSLEEARVKAFLEEELVFERYVFPPGDFPRVDWRRPAMVDNELGDFDLQSKFYDPDMNLVTSARQPGRYGAVVEGITPAGYVIRRYVTLFCSPAKWLDEDYLNENISSDKLRLQLRLFDFLGLADQAGRADAADEHERLADLMLGNLFTNPQAAVLLAGLYERQVQTSPANSAVDPRFLDRQWWVTFKCKMAAAENRYPALNRPLELAASPATVLATGDAVAAGYLDADVAKLREICTEWAGAAHEPLVTLVAHQGTIVFHEAFGRTRDGLPMTTETPAWMASIAKLLTGVLMMEFVDQGLVDLDAPVRDYLPELARDAATPLTIRHLFTHTNGLAWHGEWGSDWNPSLENYLGLCLPYLKVGDAFEYNRLGYALAGKVMERISGRAMPFLFREHLIEPLDLRHTRIENTYGGAYSTAADMGRIGQMLLNRGGYGDRQFFSAKSFEEMLPVKLDKLVSGGDREWGIGTCRLPGSGLSPKTFGHEAASGAILRIDPEHQLVIVSTRNRTGDSYETYEQYAARLLEACVAPLTARDGHRSQ